MVNKRIPGQESEDRERDFWSRSDSTEYIDWSEARPLVLPNLKPSLKSFLIFSFAYVVAMYVLGYLGAVMGAAGHGPVWLMLVFVILTLPTSALVLGLSFTLFEGFTRTDAFGWIMLFAVPVVNAPLIWLLWGFLRRLRGSRPSE